MTPINNNIIKIFGQQLMSGLYKFGFGDHYQLSIFIFLSVIFLSVK